MKHKILHVLLLISLLLSSCSSPKKDKVILHISDIHYFSKSLTDQKERYHQYVSNLAGLDIVDENELLNEFINEIIQIHPDAIVVSGDLTLNGEKKSHEDLSDFFHQIEDNGIQVLVIPGNHDIESTKAFEIYDSVIKECESINAQEFKNIYAEYGYKEALYTDDSSLSYVYPIDSHHWALMLDTCVYGSSQGNISSQTRKWIEKIVTMANRKNIDVFTVSHHNMLIHNDLFVQNYVVEDNDSLIDLFEQNNIKINLSGHMHCMNIANTDEYYDVAIESFSLWPHPFGQLNLRKDGTIEYNTHNLNINTDSYLYLCQTFKPKDSLTNEMDDFLMNLNVDYFTGRMKEKEYYTSQKAYEEWMKNGSGLENYYIQSIVDMDRLDHTSLVIKGD